MSKGQLVTGAGNSLDVVIEQRFINPTSAYHKRAHNAQLNYTAAGGYELCIPASGPTPAVHVPIHFESKPAPLTGGVHGMEQGPAQYKLTRDAIGWQATIEIDESLHRRDVLFSHTEKVAHRGLPPPPQPPSPNTKGGGRRVKKDPKDYSVSYSSAPLP